MTIRVTTLLLPLDPNTSLERKQDMATHSISMKQPQEVVLGKDVQFSIKRNGKKLGELHVSQGNLEWVPAGSKVKTYRLRWAQVAELFEEKGRLV
jgi:hypothetical protein